MIPIILSAIGLFAVGALAPALAGPTAVHRMDVDRASATVMPFSMDGTKHVFTLTASGGTQAVLVADGDRQQIALVRAHLREESGAFARGDFSGPEAIHGPAMPGLRSLQRGHGRFQVSYADVPTGGQIVFVTRDARLVAALHQWFSAQVHDHGTHAQMHMHMPM
jgi:hypothetical protein